MILVLTDDHDAHADHIVPMLRSRGADVVRFDTACYPSQASVAARFTPGAPGTAWLRSSEGDMDLSDVGSVWYRRPKPPVVHPSVTDPRVRRILEEEAASFVDDLLHALRGPLWVPAPPGVLRLGYKTTHLQVAQQIGFEVPSTLITNSPAELLDFYCRHNGNIVSKCAGFSRSFRAGSPYLRYTEPVTTRDLLYAQSLDMAAMIFQAYVEKDLELRITVVGDQVFTASIDSQAANHARHDWRRFDHRRTRYAPYDLPPDVAERCVELTRRLGLTFGALDMIRTPDGRHVFIEINPNGQFLWVELMTELPISAALCELLIGTQHAPSLEITG